MPVYAYESAMARGELHNESTAQQLFINEQSDNKAWVLNEELCEKGELTRDYYIRVELFYRIEKCQTVSRKRERPRGFFNIQYS